MENQNQEQVVIDRFSKRLTRREVRRRAVVFPLAEVAPFFDFQEGRMYFMDAQDSLGKAWTFVVRFLNNEQLGNHISINWPHFASEKRLKVNDEVIFTERLPEYGEGPWKKFKIEIRRQIRLFGQEIWGELMV